VVIAGGGVALSQKIMARCSSYHACISVSMVVLLAIEAPSLFLVSSPRHWS
jgi:hypothetical protein